MAAIAFSAVIMLFLVSLVCPSAAVASRQVGVSLKLQGVTIPNNSVVDVRDILYSTSHGQLAQVPTNANPDLHNQALLCVTDLVDCCGSPRSVRGNWYYPNGGVVQYDTDGINRTFRRNRGPNELLNGCQFYGSIRLWRRWSPPERGRFRCELPGATDPNINQILFVNIVDIGEVTMSFFGSSTAGRNLSLMCLVTITPIALPYPSFEWFFGPNNGSLPPDLTPMETVLGSGNTYTSTLQLSPLSQSYAGIYTCQLGGSARLAAHLTVIVNTPSITVMVISNLNTPLMAGQIGNTLTCDVSGAEMLISTITYQWTRNDSSTQTQVVTNSSILSLSPLRLSYAGSYSCRIISTLLNNPVIAHNSQTVMIRVPDPQSVSIASSGGNIVLCGSPVTVTCIIKLDSAVMESELSLLLLDVQMSRDGTPLILTGPTVTGTTFTYTIQLNSFGRNDSGNYACLATVRPQHTSAYLSGGTLTLGNTREITIGKQKALCSCSSEIGVAVGTQILIEGIIAGVIIVVVMLCKSMKRQGKSGKSEFAVSENLAYGQVKLDTFRDVGGEYEDPDKLARPGCGGGNYEPTGFPVLYEDKGHQCILQQHVSS